MYFLWSCFRDDKKKRCIVAIENVFVFLMENEENCSNQCFQKAYLVVFGKIAAVLSKVQQIWVAVAWRMRMRISNLEVVSHLQNEHLRI